MPEGAGKPRQLLTINYHQDTNRVVAKLLQVRGYRVCSAATLAEAEQILIAQQVDLMLCRMTASDGDCAEFIERTFKKHHVPSVAISGSLETQSRAARLSPHAVRGILWIPIDTTTMYLAIATAFSDSPRRIGVCPDCDGKGTIALLTTKCRCGKCDGNGLADPTIRD
jgi:CheY-like chemotaxis protein